jgi:hypothetical protein
VGLTLETPVVARFLASPEVGERRKTLNVVPPLSVRLGPEVALLPASGSRAHDFQVHVRGEVPGKAEVRLELPPGWASVPPAAMVEIHTPGEEIATRFKVQAPATTTSGLAEVVAVVRREGREFRTGYKTIAYPHIEERHLYAPATSSVRILDVKVPPGVKVGYVMGAGDGVPGALEEIGASVTLLTEDDLALADLSRYSTIVLGIRAYSRKDLRSYNRRVLDYAEAGGNLVVQYNRADFNSLALTPGETPSSSPFTPYPAVVTSKRITDAATPLSILEPRSPLFTSPNLITAKDFEGWVQERGIQFLEARDPHYVELLSGSDPFPLNSGVKKGILVVARVGKGTWTYVGLGLFRQVASGTPGAYRILANLVSRPRGIS